MSCSSATPAPGAACCLRSPHATKTLHFHRHIVHAQAEAGRYVVFVGNACPWCHRVLLTLIVRDLLPAVTVVNMADDPERASRGGFHHLPDLFSEFSAAERHDGELGGRCRARIQK